MTSYRERLASINNRLLITPKLMYFTMNLVVYSFHLFRAAFITDFLLLDKKYVGLSGTLMGLVSFPCITLWSTFSDSLGRHKLILSAITFASVISFEMLFLPISNAVIRLFYSMTFLVLYSAFLAGMQPLLDFEALSLLSSKPGFSKEIYGRQRLWGTIAYSCVTLGGAYLMKIFGYTVIGLVMPTAAVMFVVTLYFTALPDRPKRISFRRGAKLPEQDVVSQHEMPQHESSAHQDEGLDTKQQLLQEQQVCNQSDVNKEFSKDELIAQEDQGHLVQVNEQIEGFKHRKVASPWLTLLTDANYMFFLFVVLMLGLARSVMTIFLALFWKSTLGMSTMQVALAGAVFGMALEVVVFFVAKYISPVLGNYWMLVIAQLAMVVRCWAYFMIPKEAGLVWLVYGIELLKGLSFGMAHSAAVKIANEAAPEGLEATAQALYNSVYVQLPTVISGLLGMWAYHQFKEAAPKYIFFATSVVSTLALVLFFVKYSFEGKIRFKLW